MLDTKFIREHVEEVKENIKNRHAKADVDAFVALDNQRRDILQKVEAMKNERNTVTKEISQLKRNKENADAQIAAMKKLGDDIDEGFLREHGALPVDQALRGAYRLARVLNDLFDN